MSVVSSITPSISRMSQSVRIVCVVYIAVVLIFTETVEAVASKCGALGDISKPPLL